MPNIIAIILILFLSSTAQAEDIKQVQLDTRGFIERSTGYDGLPYTDFGANIKLDNGPSSVSIKRGVVFSPATRGSLAIGNHQWYYTGIYIGFRDVGTKGLAVSLEPFTEINPIEGNDFGFTKQSSVQSIGLSYSGYSFRRGKWTNGDFYTNIGYSTPYFSGKGFSDLKAHASLAFLGQRGRSDLLSFNTEDFNYAEIGIMHWMGCSLSEGLNFGFRNELNLRKYSGNRGPEVSYAFSIGLIAR